MISTIAFILLCIACVTQVVYLFRRDKKPDPISHLLLLIASLALFANLVERSLKINFVAITNTFESLLFFSGVIALVLFFYRVIARQRSLPFVLFGGTAMAVILLAIASSPLAAKEVLPPIPALQSSWLVLHVTFSFIGEAFFVVAFVAAIYFLASKDPEKKKELDRIIYTAIGVGYPIYTAGALIFGAIWAQVAWGSYWSWDPKETWALITWLTYTAYLHTRLVRTLRGRVSAILAVGGFIFTLFTFFGVNYLLPGLHSYG